MTNQLETAKEWIADLNKIIDKTDNECTKQKRDVLEWFVESVEELEGRKYRQDLIDEHIERLEQQNQRYKQALELVEDELEYAKTTGNDEVRDMYIKNSIRFINEALEREG